MGRTGGSPFFCSRYPDTDCFPRFVPPQAIMQRDHFADQDEGWRTNSVMRNNPRQRIKITDKYPLLRGGALLHQCRRRIRCTSMRFHRATDAFDIIEPHIEHHSLIGMAEHFPVQIIATVATVAGDEYAGL